MSQKHTLKKYYCLNYNNPSTFTFQLPQLLLENFDGYQYRLYISFTFQIKPLLVKMLIPQDSDLFPIANSCNYGKISSCQARFRQYTLQKVFTTIKTLNYRLPCVRTIYADICSSHWTVMPRAETYFINTFVVPNSELTWNGKHRNKELALVFEIQTKGYFYTHGLIYSYLNI